MQYSPLHRNTTLVFNGQHSLQQKFFKNVYFTYLLSNYRIDIEIEKVTSKRHWFVLWFYILCVILVKM